MQLVYIVYLFYITLFGIGIFGVNVAMWVISLGYLVYFLVMEYRISGMSKAERAAERKEWKRVKRIFAWIKIVFKALNLGMILYGVWASGTSPTAFSTIMTTLMIIVWVLEVVIALGTLVISYVANVIMAAIEDDKRSISDKINAPGRAIRSFGRGFKRFFGFGSDEDEPEDDGYVRDERFVRWEAELDEEIKRDKAGRR